MKVLEGTWEEIQEKEQELRGHWLRVEVGARQDTNALGCSEDLERAWSLEELLALPKARRSKIVRHQAAMAAEYYRTDPEVLEWEKLGVGDIYDDAP